MRTNFEGYEFEIEEMLSAFLLHWEAEASLQEVYEDLFFKVDEQKVPSKDERRVIGNAAAVYVTNTNPDESFEGDNLFQWQSYRDGWKADQMHDMSGMGEWCEYCNENPKDPSEEYCEKCKEAEQV